jgi:hypothetical protein
MPKACPTEMGRLWAIRSMPVRSRDGPERLNQAYRRLLDGTSCTIIPALCSTESAHKDIPPCASPFTSASPPNGRNVSKP